MLRLLGVIRLLGMRLLGVVRLLVMGLLNVVRLLGVIRLLGMRLLGVVRLVMRLLVMRLLGVMNWRLVMVVLTPLSVLPLSLPLTVLPLGRLGLVREDWGLLLLVQLTAVAGPGVGLTGVLLVVGVGGVVARSTVFLLYVTVPGPCSGHHDITPALRQSHSLS